MSAFRRLWGGTAAANLADGIVIAAAPLLAASLTRDPLLVSGLIVAQQAPWFLFTLFAGVIVDRLDRRKLLVTANAARALALGLLAVTVATGSDHLYVLYAVMFSLGMAETIIDNAALAVLPSLMDRSRLEWANGRIFATQSVLDELVGPPLGGALFAVSVTAAFFTGSVAFALAAVLLALLPRPQRQDKVAAGPPLGLWGSIGEGVHWFWGNRPIRTVAMMAGVGNMFSAATLGVLVLLATGEFGLGPGGYGLLLAAGALGGIAAGFGAEALVDRLGTLRAPFYLGAVCMAVLAIALAPVLTTRALDEATGKYPNQTKENQDR